VKKPFDSFVMFAAMRTGSNFLEANLNAMTGVSCHGEVFNPYFIGQKDKTEFLGFSLIDRAADPMALVRAMRAASSGISGFRYFHDHDPRVFEAVLEDERCAKIVLTRNPVESYVSLKIAQETGQWKLTNAKNLKSAQARFDAREFEAHLADLQSFQLRIQRGLQVTGQTAFWIDYEDINDLEILNGLAAFLGVPALEALDDSLKKQNPEEITRKVANPEEMEQALSRLDRFNLSRTPNFEPRRAAMVPAFVAARRAPLLFMPVRSGPEKIVLDWLSAFGGLESDFTQKTLRQWKKARPKHRAFTVLRHPVARAYAAFQDQILHGTFRDLRGQLEKAHKLPLPPVGQTYPDAKTHRAGFLAFLKWLKLNLSGQTGLRVDPHWASQSAILQGFSQFQTPDLVLREDRLAAGLAFLATEIGLAEAPAVQEVPTDPQLAAIYDDEIEAAAREAYARDYVAFGFRDWTP
jgi:LPS sulfotransferase NodH